MKKNILIAMLTVAALSFVACGKKTEVPAEETPAAAVEETPAAAVEETPAAAVEETPATTEEIPADLPAEGTEAAPTE